MHLAHPMQRPGFTEAISLTEMAPTGQALSHTPHPRHCSESTTATDKAMPDPCRRPLIRRFNRSSRTLRACALDLRKGSSSLGSNPVPLGFQRSGLSLHPGQPLSSRRLQVMPLFPLKPWPPGMREPAHRSPGWKRIARRRHPG